MNLYDRNAGNNRTFQEENMLSCTAKKKKKNSEVLYLPEGVS